MGSSHTGVTPRNTFLPRKGSKRAKLKERLLAWKKPLIVAGRKTFATVWEFPRRSRFWSVVLVYHHRQNIDFSPLPGLQQHSYEIPVSNPRPHACRLRRTRNGQTRNLSTRIRQGPL